MAEQEKEKVADGDEKAVSSEQLTEKITKILKDADLEQTSSKKVSSLHTGLHT